MSSPKLICKSGYIKDLAHVLNTLEYAGNKIAAQHIVFKDGTVLEVNPEARIVLTKAEQAEVSSIRLSYKDGGGKDISYEKYSLFTKEKTETVRVHDLQTVQNDETYLVNSDGKSYHSIEDLDFFKYLPYVAERMGVEKEDGHGLFGLNGNIDIEQAKALAIEYESSIKWSHIISLDAQAAEDAGFNSRNAWKDLITSKAPQIAKAYNISLENLIINCAYHSNTDNPHVHLIFYSKNKSEGYIKGGNPQMQVASEALKSMFFNDIFKNDVREIEVEKSKYRESIRKQLDKALLRCLAKDYGQTELTDMLLDVANDIKMLDGKKKYGYMPAETKAKIDKLLQWICERDDDVNTMFTYYCDTQRQFIKNYTVDTAIVEQKVKEFRKEFFHPNKSGLRIYHNAILDFALQYNSMELPTSVRTAEEEIFNNTPTSNKLSSKTFAPAGDESEIPMPSDDDAPHEDFNYVPELEYEELLQGNEAPQATSVQLRTAEDKILNIKPSTVEMSSENYYRQAIKQNKEVFSDVSKQLSSALRDSWNIMGSNDAHELKRLLNEKELNTAAIEAKTSALFRKLVTKEQCAELELCKNQIVDKLKDTCTDPNMLLELDARIDTALYHGESNIPYNFIIQSFCKNLNTEHIKFVCKELKPELKEFCSQLYSHLCSALTGGNPAATRYMYQYKINPTAEEMDELLKALSTKDYDFTAEKEKLYQSVFSKLRERGVLQPESEYRSVIDKLFYREGDNAYDTLHMRETIENVFDRRDEIIHKHNMYMCRQLTKLLFQSLARLMHGQAENANRYNKDEHGFAAKSQFRNKKQFAEHSTLRESSISY